jgi:hypothetical protein
MMETKSKMAAILNDMNEKLTKFQKGEMAKWE